MLTKLTRTILAHDTELKVWADWLLVLLVLGHMLMVVAVSPQKTWESLTPMGRVSVSLATLPSVLGTDACMTVL